MKKVYTLLTLLLLILFSQAQTTVVLRPGPENSKGSSLSSYVGNTSTNYGTYGVFGQMVWFNAGNNKTWKFNAVFEFDMASIPANAIITHAGLDLYADNPTTTFVGNPSTPMNGSNNAAYLRRVTEPWGALTVNWANQPKDTIMNESILPTSVSDTQNYLGIDVTNLVQDQLVYGNYGFKILPVTTQPSNSMVFRSSNFPDSTFRPTLTVTYITPDLAVNLGNDVTACDTSHVIFDPAITGGIPPLTYAWSSTGDTLSCSDCKNPEMDVTQNTVVVLSVTDNNGTVVTDTVTYTPSGTINTIALSLTNTDITCTQSNGGSTAEVLRGITPVIYTWGDGASNIGIATQSHSYSKAGTYVVSVVDSAGCIDATFATIANSGLAVTLAEAIQPTCVGDSSGSIKIAVTGGQAPYTYRWVTGQTTDSIGGVIAGNYYVTVTDGSACSSLFYHTLSPAHDVWAYYAYANPTNANCSDNGIITTSVTGGSSPYTYEWSNGDSLSTIYNLGAGTYNLTVTDSVGCTRKAKAKINYNCASIISGYAFVDTNSNCTMDTTERPERFSFVSATKDGEHYYGSTNSKGKYTITVPDTGTYELEAEVWGGVCANYVFCGDSGNIVTIHTLGDSSMNNNFTAVNSSGFDLTGMLGWTNANPGFEKEYWIMPFNQASEPFTGTATVTFSYDTNLVYLTSPTPVPVHDPLAHTLTWIVNDSDIPSPTWDWSHMRLMSFFHVPLSLDLGLRLYSDVYISPTDGDCDTTNNSGRFSELVRGSFDPNEKEVEPAEYIHPDDSLLTYTIHFQNTGTDSTHFIIIRDTLSAYLDPTTIRNIASSHPYSNFELSEKGAMAWTFNPLRLVDSITNPEGSKGFIKFSIEKKKNVPIGAIIKNTAHIIFDYNDAIVTNTVTNKVEIPASIHQITSKDKISVRAYPNPFNERTRIVIDGMEGKYDFELFDVTGRTLKRIAAQETKQFDLTRDALPAGIYFYRVAVSGKAAANGKLVIE